MALVRHQFLFQFQATVDTFVNNLVVNLILIPKDPFFLIMFNNLAWIEDLHSGIIVFVVVVVVFTPDYWFWFLSLFLIFSLFQNFMFEVMIRQQNIVDDSSFTWRQYKHIYKWLTAVRRRASPSPQGHSCWSRVRSFSELVQPQSDAGTRHLGRVHSQNRSKRSQSRPWKPAGVCGVLTAIQ